MGVVVSIFLVKKSTFFVRHFSFVALYISNAYVSGGFIARWSLGGSVDRRHCMIMRVGSVLIATIVDARVPRNCASAR